MTIGLFQIKGVGEVMADLNQKAQMPLVRFSDGIFCEGLPRELEEVHALGYEDVSLGNFVHEAIHLFLAWKGEYIPKSVSYRAGQDADFTDKQILEDAAVEERIVLGFQVCQNRVQGDLIKTAKVGGFNLHLAGAAESWARVNLWARHGI